MKKSILLFAGLAFLTFKNQAQTVTDYDGNVYNTVTIGSQIWLVENLKVTHYRNGDTIPYFNNTDQNAWCYYNNDSSINNPYGKLYNKYTIDDSRGVCPIDWHVSTYQEFQTLINYLGGDSLAGGKLKEADTLHWQNPNINADNSSGFTGLPGGCAYEPNFNFLFSRGKWWAKDTSMSEYLYLQLTNDDSYATLTLTPSEQNLQPCCMLYSVRCVKNSTTQINEINYQEKMKIYPNPAIDRVYIDCAKRQNVKMQVYNMIGGCVLQSVLTSRTNEIDISSLTTGIYVIQLTGADETFQRKLIKE